MTIDALYQAARLRVRKSIADDLDQDIQRIADTAIADLKRIGVVDAWLEEPSDPLIVETILSYVKANYSIDTDAYAVLAGIYDMNIVKVKGDGKYFVAPEPISSDPEPSDPSGDPSGDPDPGTDPSGDPYGDPDPGSGD